MDIWQTAASPFSCCAAAPFPKIILYRFVLRKVKLLKKPKAPGQARGHTDHKLMMVLAHNIAQHMSTPAMPYNQVWACGTRWKCPFVGPKSVFDKPWCEGVGGVTWRHRRVFPICLDRWKAQSV